MRPKDNTVYKISKRMQNTALEYFLKIKNQKNYTNRINK